MVNINKALEFLRSNEKINPRYLYDSNQIALGNEEAILGLLEDIWKYYAFKVKPLSASSLAHKESNSNNFYLIPNKYNTNQIVTDNSNMKYEKPSSLYDQKRRTSDEVLNKTNTKQSSEVKKPQQQQQQFSAQRNSHKDFLTLDTNRDYNADNFYLKTESFKSMDLISNAQSRDISKIEDSSRVISDPYSKLIDFQNSNKIVKKNISVIHKSPHTRFISKTDELANILNIKKKNPIQIISSQCLTTPKKDKCFIVFQGVNTKKLKTQLSNMDKSERVVSKSINIDNNSGSVRGKGELPNRLQATAKWGGESFNSNYDNAHNDKTRSLQVENNNANLLKESKTEAEKG